jgi:2-polyprenyl-3-methyl-5-hydroxy-6-metoxy-1,4-benzoquinol methylase
LTLRKRILSSIARRYSGASTTTPTLGAVEALRDTWSQYPAQWRKDPQLNLGVTTLGEEWGGPEFADFIVELVGPYLGPEVDVVELGCGGGKFSQRVAPKCRSLLCTDISRAMIEHTRESLAERNVVGDVSYQVLNGVDFQGIPSGSADLIFSYDVLLHLQPQNVFSYMLDARRVLREDGVFMLHQINLASPGGTDHFLAQYAADTWKCGFADPRRRGHVYFMSEDQMRALAALAGLSFDHVVSDQGAFNTVTAERDLIGFLRKRRSRLDVGPGDSVRLLRTRDGHTVYALIAGELLAFVSARQFERAGFRWENVERVEDEELATIPSGGLLEPWE